MQDKSKVKTNYSERLVEWMMNALFELAEYVIAKCSLPVQEQKITPLTPHADMQKREKPIQFSMEDRMVEGELF